MDINLLAVLAICTIYGSWRLIVFRQERNRREAIRARVAWMLWLAANQMP